MSKEIKENKERDLVFSSDARHELQQPAVAEQQPQGADDAE